MTDRLARSLPSRAGAHRAFVRLRGRAWPILQTAAAAVAAWYAAELLLDEQAPVFAPIAAVIALGAAYGQRRERALELVGGVVLGIGLADLLVQGIGSGGWQLGVLVLVAMSTAVMLGGGPVLVTEAGVSAILLVLLEPSGTGLPPSRLVEAVIGGAIALAVAALAFPPDPVLHVGRSVQSVFGGLGRTLEELAAALDDPGDSGKEARRLAADGAALATRSFEERPDLALAEIVAQVRSTAIDIVRAAEAGAGEAGGGVPGELTTEELLAAGEPTEGVARPRS
jgi:uncharacterized membrane protein YgaE (UPF0421/DUF939 family)